jgi:hypothetical protein
MDIGKGMAPATLGTDPMNTLPALYTVEAHTGGWAILYQGRYIGEWFRRRCDATKRFNRAYGTYNTQASNPLALHTL